MEIKEILQNGSQYLGTADADEFVSLCLKQVIQSYSSKTIPISEDNPGCGVLVQWALVQLGVPFSYDGYYQYRSIEAAKLTCTVEQAMMVRGALLFVQGQAQSSSYKVAVSLGRGCGAIDAIGNTVGVVRIPNSSKWHWAGFIPGLSYSEYNIINTLYAQFGPSNPYRPHPLG